MGMMQQEKAKEERERKEKEEREREKLDEERREEEKRNREKFIEEKNELKNFEQGEVVVIRGLKKGPKPLPNEKLVKIVDGPFYRESKQTEMIEEKYTISLEGKKLQMSSQFLYRKFSLLQLATKEKSTGNLETQKKCSQDKKICSLDDVESSASWEKRLVHDFKDDFAKIGHSVENTHEVAKQAIKFCQDNVENATYDVVESQMRTSYTTLEAPFNKIITKLKEMEFFTNFDPSHVTDQLCKHVFKTENLPTKEKCAENLQTKEKCSQEKICSLDDVKSLAIWDERMESSASWDERLVHDFRDDFKKIGYNVENTREFAKNIVQDFQDVKYATYDDVKSEMTIRYTRIKSAVDKIITELKKMGFETNSETSLYVLDKLCDHKFYEEKTLQSLLDTLRIKKDALKDPHYLNQEEQSNVLNNS